MHEKIVFIGNDKGFVYGSIKKGLEEQGFNIISVNSDIAYIMGKESESKIWLLYIENEVTDYVKIFEYIKKAVISNDVMLYLIASDSEIRDVHRYIPEH